MASIRVGVRIRPPLGQAAPHLSIKGQVSGCGVDLTALCAAAGRVPLLAEMARAAGAVDIPPHLGPPLERPQYGQFQLDWTGDEDVTQDEVFSELVLPQVNLFLQGLDSTFLLYGASQTGKTYTLEARAWFGSLDMAGGGGIEAGAGPPGRVSNPRPCGSGRSG